MTAPEPRREGCCRAAVDSDGHAHDHSQWYAELAEARQAHAEALADNERVAVEMAKVILAVEQLKAERDRAIAQRNAMAAVNELTMRNVRPVFAAARALVAHWTGPTSLSSLAYRTRTGELKDALIAAVAAQPAPSERQAGQDGPEVGEVGVGGSEALDAAMSSIWLHGNWRWLTGNMTTEQKTAAADAVDRAHMAIKDDDECAAIRADRWWLDA